MSIQVMTQREIDAMFTNDWVAEETHAETLAEVLASINENTADFGLFSPSNEEGN